MPTTLRFLSVLCAVALPVCVVRSLLVVAGLVIFAGIVFYALAAILERLARIEKRLAAGMGHVATDLGDFEKLEAVEGEAMCVGCKRTVAKTGLYHHKTLDIYYHPECLRRDSGM